MMNRCTPFAIAVLVGLLPTAVQAQTPPPSERPPQDRTSPEPKREPEIRIIGTGGGGGGSGAVTFDWDGPDTVAYGIYDHGCLPWVQEFEQLVDRGRPLVGSVRPAARTWQATLAAARGVLNEPKGKAGYAAVKEFASLKRPDLFSAGAAVSLMNGDPEAALAQLLAGVEQAPDDPDLLFNFAASLAQRELPNESLAAIQRLRGLKQLPSLPDGVDPEAALAYMTGYNQMLLGQLADAKANFGRTIAQGPYLYEAKRALALVQAHEGNTGQAKDTYLAGMWRFTPKQLVFCGGSREDDVRPPVDDMFDTSMGVDGKLVDFWLPDKASDLARFLEMAGSLATERLGRAEPLKQRMIAMGDNPKFADTDTPYNAWADKMTQLISGLDENEPYVLAAKDTVDRAFEQAGQVSGTNQAFVLERIVELSVTPGNHCRTFRSLISSGIQGVLPHAERLEAAQREYARVWYKIATGLNAKIGDPEWHEYNDVALRAEIESMNAGLLSEMMSLFAFPTDVVMECPEDPPAEGDMLGQPPAPPGSPCDQIFGDLKISHSFEVPGRTGGPKIGYEVGCEKISANIEYDLLSSSASGFGTALGGFASVEIGRKGDYSIFAGARGEASGPGASGGIKSGLYLEGNNGGVTEVGGRVSLEAKAGFGKLSKSASDDMKFNLLPDPPKASRGPGLKAFDPGP
jgi:hypothetical protein